MDPPVVPPVRSQRQSSSLACCDYCSQWMQKGSLVRHFQRKHGYMMVRVRPTESGRVVTCDYCNATMMKRSLIRHFKQKHGFMAPQDGESVGESSSVVSQYKRHIDKCLYEQQKINKWCGKKQFCMLRVVDVKTKRTHCYICNLVLTKFPMVHMDYCERKLAANSVVPKAAGVDAVVFQCHLCMKTFAKKTRVRTHIRKVHHNNKGKALSQARQVRRYHHCCDQCDNTFQYAYHLNSHIRLVHTTKTYEKPHKCDRCAYSTLIEGRLKTHKYVKHGDQSISVFRCDICSGINGVGVFASKKKLWGHMKKHIQRLNMSDKPVM